MNEFRSGSGTIAHKYRSTTSLRYYEQQVNDRQGSSAAPDIDPKLLPENAVSHPLAWRKVPSADVESFMTANRPLQSVLPRLIDNAHTFMPVHPLSVHRYQSEQLIYSGKIQFSASYRTVFFEPDPGGILDGWIPDGMDLMLKLSLEEPLPGIPGDRRLTRDKVEKCILLSDALPIALATGPVKQQFEIIPEFFGMTSDDNGAIFRLLPKNGVLPLFSLYSIDRNKPSEPPLIVRHLSRSHSSNSNSLIEDLGSQLALPLVRALLAGFREGFALEMHAQNTLISLGSDRLIDCIFFRDLEGVVFSNMFRAKRGLEAKLLDKENKELHSGGRSMRRWFNRNVDHDLGRIFGCSLNALVRFGLLDEYGRKRSIQSIRSSVRHAIYEAQMQGTAWPGSLLPYSRAPWGNGLKPGHYFRTRYR